VENVFSVYSPETVRSGNPGYEGVMADVFITSI